VPGIRDDIHPRDLSEGQRLALALAVQLCPRPDVIMLDEPTRGLDETAKHRFADVISELAGEGRAIVVATHDVEFVANVADRVVVLADGEIVADGPTADVVVASPVFAPQVAKVMSPARWLTVDQITNALATEEVR
jgi:energy-coupling factor transport system ATP-binding protein